MSALGPAVEFVRGGDYFRSRDGSLLCCIGVYQHFSLSRRELHRAQRIWVRAYRKRQGPDSVRVDGSFTDRYRGPCDPNSIVCEIAREELGASDEGTYWLVVWYEVMA